MNPNPNQYQHVDRAHEVKKKKTNFRRRFGETSFRRHTGRTTTANSRDRAINAARHCGHALHEWSAIRAQQRQLMVEEYGDVRLSIQTWEDDNLIRVGFQLCTEGNQIQEAVSLSRDEISLLLTLEEECSR